jgi:hypothetical protein
MPRCPSLSYMSPGLTTGSHTNKISAHLAMVRSQILKHIGNHRSYM